MRKIIYLFLVVLIFIFCGCGKDNDPLYPGKDDTGTDSEDNEKTEDKSYIFPDDFTDELLNKTISIKNNLIVTSTFGYSINDNIILSSDTLFTPTDVCLPSSIGYVRQLTANQKDKLKIIPNGFKLYDSNTKLLRVGSKIGDIKGKVTYSNNQYCLTLTHQPTISGNLRPSVPDVGNHNLKIASMNLEFYLANPTLWNDKYGASSATEFTRQHTKILSAMTKMNADIYAVCEIQEGNYANQYLVSELNRAVNSTTGRYKFIDTGDTKSTTYTKVVFIYDSDKVSPYKKLMNYGNSYYRLRHLAQCFELNKNGARVIIAMNHYKSKSGNGTGNDKDKNDGQGSYNATRFQEAKDGIEFYREVIKYYGDDDVLVLGDLNSYSQEDPIREFTANGYVNELKRYFPKRWSYIYHGEVGNLDHSLASPSLSSQVSGASPWIVNAGEPLYFGYKNSTYYVGNEYRYSDHNPIITGLMLR